MLARHPSSIRTSHALKRIIQASLDRDKAFDVVVLDLREKSDMADYMIIASGTSTRHLDGIAAKLMEDIRRSGLCLPQAEGIGQSDWVLVDTPYVIIHLFRPEARGRYGLEKMWGAEIRVRESELVC